MKFWWFTDTDKIRVQWQNDAGLLVDLAADVHPSGRTGYSWTPPPDYPNKNGGNVLQTDQYGVVDNLRGRLITLDGEWIFACDQHAISDSFKKAAREYSGNMCGIRVPGVPPVPGGASFNVPPGIEAATYHGRTVDPRVYLPGYRGRRLTARNPQAQRGVETQGAGSDLVLSWFLDRYPADAQRRIKDAYKAKGYKDVLLSWPDSRAMGIGAQEFGNFVRGLRREGFTVGVMLLSKVFDPADNGSDAVVEEYKRRISEILPFLTKNAHKLCAAWEASLWLSPATLQKLVDWLAPQIIPWGALHYIHLQEGYSHFDYDGPDASFAGYWNRNIGKLHGIWHQKMLNWSNEEYPDLLKDILDRFAGQFFCTPDSGFGHPFDLVALEITAMLQFGGDCSEAEGDEVGRIAIGTEPTVGPFGPVRVMGSGNGH